MVQEDIELKSIQTRPEANDKNLLIEVDDSNIDHGKKNSVPKVVTVVAFYIATSITMIMVNKTVLNYASLPMTFLWGQLVTAVLLLRVADYLNLLRLPPISKDVAMQLRYLIVMNVTGLALNTLCLQHIDAALYQVARSLILPMTALISSMATGTTVSHRVCIACAIITAGFLIGVVGERRVQVSTLGVTFGVLSSIATAIHSFAIKHSFSQLPNSGAFDMVYYNNLLSSVLLLPIVSLEMPILAAFIREHSRVEFGGFVFGTLVAGASGLLINLASFLQIKVTSPLTHTVSSAARGVLQTLACRAVLGETVTHVRWIGISVTLCGSALYSWFKSRE